ncbi:MAG: fibronectin type III domain-containing protein [Oscillospiraceae bacterium]|nr:fibronectin type III domain-containing protein [Oscillospiraceae bacterium]
MRRVVIDRNHNQRALTDNRVLGATTAENNIVVVNNYRTRALVSTPIDRNFEYHSRKDGERAWLNALTPFDHLVWALSGPLTELDRNPPEITQATFNASDWTTREFTGRTFEDAARAFNEYAMANRFGDGLPLVVPTPALVDEMLTGTARDRDEVLGLMKMRGGIITIEKIAINAVMAGANPEYLPVIIAAMEAYAGGWEFDKMWYHPMSSGGPFNMGVLISGPLAEEIGMSMTTGWTGAANHANNTIGRAIRMSIRNIGQNTTPLVDTTNRTGRLYDHTLLTIAENTKDLPPGWVSHSQMMGFEAHETTVTFFGFQGALQGYGAEETHPMHVLAQSRANVSGNTNFVFMPPGMASHFAEQQGMTTKTDMKEWYATHNAEGNPVARAPGIAANTHIVVVGGDPGGIQSAVGFMLYGQNLVNTTQLVSGATLTTNARGATVPSTPQNFTIEYTYNSAGVATHATLRWDAPLSDGGMPVTGYQVNWIHGGNRQTAPWTDVPAPDGGARPDAREFTVALANTHLAPTLVDRRGDAGVYEFFFKVRATNEVVNTSEIVSNAINMNRIGGRGAWAMDPTDITDRTVREFGLRAFNNGTCTEVPDLAGRIRIWPQVNGVGTPIPMSANIIAELPDGSDAMQFVTRNRQWVDGDGFQDYYVNFDVDKDAPWQYIDFTVTAFGQSVTIRLINNLYTAAPVPVFGVQYFNNGTDAQVPSLAGTIRIWMQIDGVNAIVPYADLEVIALDQDGEDVIEYVRINRIWNNTDYVNLIDVVKQGADWQYMDLEITLGTQSVELELINNTFEP